MDSISKEQYEFAQARIEELLPLVNDNTPANDRNAVELTMMSDIVIAYEKKHYPIGKPTVAELIGLSIEEKGITQKQLASELGVSPSRVNDYISGRDVGILKPLSFTGLARGTYFAQGYILTLPTQYILLCQVSISSPRNLYTV